jgi:four helix bundle protein
MATVKRFEDLEVWQLARSVALDIYNETLEKSFNHDYELKGQIRKSSGSAMDNISEGFERGGRKEFIQLLGMAKGSAGEIRSQLYRAFDRQHITQEKFDLLQAKTLQLSRKLSNLITYLKNSEYKGFKFHEDEGDYPNLEP